MPKIRNSRESHGMHVEVKTGALYGDTEIKQHTGGNDPSPSQASSKIPDYFSGNRFPQILNVSHMLKMNIHVNLKSLFLPAVFQYYLNESETCNSFLITEQKNKNQNT